MSGLGTTGNSAKTPPLRRWAPRRGSLSLLTAALLTGSVGMARANPIMVVDEAYVQQVPGTTHVQVTRLRSLTRMSTMELTRDGQAVVAEPLSVSGPSRDLGSGVSNIHALVACDCDVPIGHHAYSVDGMAAEIAVTDATTATAPIPTPDGNCEVECESRLTLPAPTGGTSGEGAGGSSIIGPVGGSSAGGGTSAAAGATGSATGGTLGSAGASADYVDDSDDDGSSSGCSVAGQRRGMMELGVLAALGLILVCRRK